MNRDRDWDKSWPEFREEATIIRRHGPRRNRYGATFSKWSRVALGENVGKTWALSHW